LLSVGSTFSLFPSLRAAATENFTRSTVPDAGVTLYRMVMPIGTPFLKEKK